MTRTPLASKVLAFLRFTLRLLRRFALSILALLLLYLTIVGAGLVPVNNDFVPADDGIEILLISNAVHADLVLPIVTEHFDWRTEFHSNYFAGDTSGATHIAIGWGDAGFYLHTPSWNDLKFATAANALLWPSKSCVHASMTRDEYIRPHARAVRISPSQYAKMVVFIQNTFLTNEAGEKIVLDVAYGQNDAFFESHGHYHALNTCNSWAGRGLKAAGVRVPWLTPLPKSVFLYLPDADEPHK